MYCFLILTLTEYLKNFKSNLNTFHIINRTITLTNIEQFFIITFIIGIINLCPYILHYGIQDINTNREFTFIRFHCNKEFIVLSIIQIFSSNIKSLHVNAIHPIRFIHFHIISNLLSYCNLLTALRISLNCLSEFPASLSRAL